MGKSNRLRFSAGLDRKPEWTGAGLRRFYCLIDVLVICKYEEDQINKNSAGVDIAPAFGEITTACNVGQAKNGSWCLLEE